MPSDCAMQTIYEFRFTKPQYAPITIDGIPL
jgi:hypothetical protein